MFKWFEFDKLSKITITTLDPDPNENEKWDPDPNQNVEDLRHTAEKDGIFVRIVSLYTAVLGH